MYYEIKVNSQSAGVFGHDRVENIHLSVGGAPGHLYIFASAVCWEGERQYHLDWLQHSLGPEDVVEITPSQRRDVAALKHKFAMGRPKKAPSEAVICDFCQRNETEVPRIIHIDEHRPSICSDCVDICNAMLEEPSIK
jgi:hypothetical protein